MRRPAWSWCCGRSSKIWRVRPRLATAECSHRSMPLLFASPRRGTPSLSRQNQTETDQNWFLGFLWCLLVKGITVYFLLIFQENASNFVFFFFFFFHQSWINLFDQSWHTDNRHRSVLLQTSIFDSKSVCTTRSRGVRNIFSVSCRSMMISPIHSDIPGSSFLGRQAWRHDG